MATELVWSLSGTLFRCRADKGRTLLEVARVIDFRDQAVLQPYLALVSVRAQFARLGNGFVIRRRLNPVRKANVTCAVQTI